MASGYCLQKVVASAKAPPRMAHAWHVPHQGQGNGRGGSHQQRGSAAPLQPGKRAAQRHRLQRTPAPQGLLRTSIHSRRAISHEWVTIPVTPLKADLAREGFNNFEKFKYIPQDQL